MIIYFNCYSFILFLIIDLKLNLFHYIHDICVITVTVTFDTKLLVQNQNHWK